MKKKSENIIKAWVDSLPKGSCSSTKDSSIKFEERKSKITFDNKSNKTCLKIDVDGGVVPSAEKTLRCDKLLVEKSKPLFCFIELKGNDIEHAIKQLESSLKDARLNPSCSQQKLAFVVGKNHSPISSPLIQKRIKSFKGLNAELIIKNTPATYPL